MGLESFYQLWGLGSITGAYFGLPSSLKPFPGQSTSINCQLEAGHALTEFSLTQVAEAMEEDGEEDEDNMWERQPSIEPE